MQRDALLYIACVFTKERAVGELGLAWGMGWMGWTEAESSVCSARVSTTHKEI